MINSEPTLYCENLEFQWQDLGIFSACVFGGYWYGPVVQELGKQIIEIENIFTLYREIRDGLRPKLSEISAMTELEAETMAYRFLERCILRTGLLGATDTRDKIYAILGLLRAYSIVNKLNVEIPTYPDYEETVPNVFRDFTMLLMYKTKSLDIWSWVTDETSRWLDPSIPSWVPQLYQFSSGHMWNLRMLKHSSQFHASSTSKQSLQPAYIDFDFDTQIAKMLGMDLDTIEEVARFIDDNISPCLQLLLHLPKRYLNGQHIGEAFWRTLTANESSAPPQSMEQPCNEFLVAQSMIFRHAPAKRGQLDQLDLHLEPFKKIESQMPHPAIPTLLEIVEKTLSRSESDANANTRAIEFSRYQFVPLLNRRYSHAGAALFRTKKGYLGLCPYSCQQGDEVWLLRGAKVFFALRRLGSNLHKLMGESYVHGFMQGQALKGESVLSDWSPLWIK